MSKNDVRTVKAQEERDERGEAAEMKIGSPVKPVAGRLLGAEAGWGAGSTCEWRLLELVQVRGEDTYRES